MLSVGSHRTCTFNSSALCRGYRWENYFCGLRFSSASRRSQPLFLLRSLGKRFLRFLPREECRGVSQTAAKSLRRSLAYFRHSSSWTVFRPITSLVPSSISYLSVPPVQSTHFRSLYCLRKVGARSDGRQFHPRTPSFGVQTPSERKRKTQCSP